MSLPATRFALSHVGAAGNQRPHPAACADPQVRSLFRRRQLGHGPVCAHDVPHLQRRHFPELPQKAAAPANPARRMILVLDNARYHHAILLAPFLRHHRSQLRLLFLPPYSPQLAPIERVWKLTRRLATHNRYFATLPEVLNAVNACFNRWRRPNAVLRRLCCIT